MRDQHWQQHHQEKKKTEWLQQNPDEDEIQPLIFDLVRADKVEAMKSLLPRFTKDVEKVINELLVIVAGSGSPAMVDVLGQLFDEFYNHHVGSDWKSNITTALTAAIATTNFETFRHLLHRFVVNLNRIWERYSYSYILPEILKSGSEELLLN